MTVQAQVQIQLWSDPASPQREIEELAGATPLVVVGLVMILGCCCPDSDQGVGVSAAQPWHAGARLPGVFWTGTWRNRLARDCKDGWEGLNNRGESVAMMDDSGKSIT